MTEVASAFITLMPSTKGFSSATERQISPGLSSTGKRAGSKFGSTFKSSAMSPLKGLVAGFGAMFAAQKISGFLKDSIAEAREAQVVTARTQSVIKSMGLTGKVSAGQIGSLAMAISNKTAVDDEAIQSGQNLLLTFGNIASSAGKAGGVFSQTSQLMVDMSAAMGTDMKSSAVQLGKALNDPIKGVSALARSGVSFTEQQKEQIKTLTESGNVLGAQNIILGEVKKQFGGAAASMATPAERAKVAFANLKEQIGTALLPVIDRLLTFFSGKLVPAISSFISQVQSGTGAGGAFASAFRGATSVLSTVFGFINGNREAFGIFAGTILAVVAAVKIWTAVQTALNIVMSANPVGLVVIALAALVAGLVMAYKHSETFRNVVDGVFGFLKTVVAATIGFIADHWQLIVSIVGGPLAAIGILVVKHWGAIKGFVMGAVSAVIGFVRDHWRLIITIIGGPLGLAVALVTKYWGQIKSVTSTVWNAVKAVIQTQINAAKAVVSTAIAAIRGYFNLIGAIVDKVRGWFGAMLSAIKSKLGEAVQFVGSIPGKIKSALGDLSNMLYSAGRALIGGLIKGIVDRAKDVAGAVSGIADHVKGFFGGSPVEHGPLLPWNTGTPGKVLMGMLAKGITDGGAAVSDAAGNVADTVKKHFEGLRDSLKSTLEGLKSDFASLKSSVASAFTGDLFSATNATDFLTNLSGTRLNIAAVSRAFHKLEGWGLKPEFLAQLIQSGNAPLILDLASGTRSDARSAGAEVGAIQSLSNQLGGAVARDSYGPRIDRISRQLDDLTRAVKRQGREFGREINGAVVAGHRGAV
ncbi:phage tail protein [Nocardioides sp. URHA0032]|uniref:phage tail protein n=1 Tax=Nocardioides sp. URHA0032 TaxID=1380388 RepID=UPI00048B236B|nr:hypothetical protein [Nocardioides sp. URHA0032]